jgi:hypothetical protein
MNILRHLISAGPTGRTFGGGLGFVLVLVLAATQGVEHTHTTALDAAQCAVCHWNETRPAPPMPAVSANPTPPLVLEFTVPAGAAGSVEPAHSPPARAPPPRS